MILTHLWRAGWLDLLFSHQNTQRLPLKSRAVEPVVCFLPQLLLLFVPSLSSMDQVDPLMNMGLQVRCQTRL